MSIRKNKKRALPKKAIKSLSDTQLKKSLYKWEEEIEIAHGALNTKKFDVANKQVKKIEQEIKKRGI